MTNIERIRTVLDGKLPSDRLPRIEWAAWWGDTLNKWYEQGLTREVSWDRLQTYFGLDYMRRIWMPLQKPSCPRPASHGAPIMEDEADYEVLKAHLFPTEAVQPLWVLEKLSFGITSMPSALSLFISERIFSTLQVPSMASSG